MEKKRFKVVTFRGFYNADILGDAVDMGRTLIDNIIIDKWDSSFHWARVIDNHIGISFIMYKSKEGEFCYTPWLALR